MAEFRFGTKAETLERLQRTLSGAVVPEFFYFDADAWKTGWMDIIRRAPSVSGGGKIIIRSSAAGEDGAARSMAGAYLSVADVDPQDETAVKKAIARVIASYKGNGGQVIVQRMALDIAVSGVIMTRSVTDGAPYYVLDYDDVSGKTDVVTGGIGAHKTVYVYRGSAHSAIKSPRVAAMVDLARKVEAVCGETPLDIEFALGNDGTQFLLQVRRITSEHHWRAHTARDVAQSLSGLEEFVAGRSAPRPGLSGSSTVFGVMPDWNPAELLGDAPAPLAISLFRWLISDEVWRKARELMGYKRLPEEELMVTLCGRPYIDVRNSLNSFLPAGLDGKFESALVDACLARLSESPELHDKLEFEVALTVLDFDFERETAAWYPDVFTGGGKMRFRESLRALTNNALDLGHGGTLPEFISQAMKLEAMRDGGDRALEKNGDSTELLGQALKLLDECRIYGTLPFSSIARHAFIGEKLLKSAVAREALDAGRVAGFKRSIRTVFSELSRDMAKISRGGASLDGFMRRYGHLRPGAFDITSSRYADMQEMFINGELAAPAENGAFTLTARESGAIGSLLAEAGINSANPAGLLEHARLSIQWRERAKFLFTKNLSDALELFAAWGERQGLSREDTSFLTVREMEEFAARPGSIGASTLREVVDSRRAGKDLFKTVKLGYLIRNISDLRVSPVLRSRPNFITEKRVSGPVALIEKIPEDTRNIAGKIALVKNADPGYDWIFTRRIKGLVTKYGGANSHMAIRCVEMNLPAAIGCGDEIFAKLAASGYAELNCDEKTVRPAIVGDYDGA
ncbi:MAG: pyruvate, phosphate dikinase [Nitrospinae bacterium]|nr:pyruvate, phosphate dikinase [Nitrospinota bacterium]